MNRTLFPKLLFVALIALAVAPVHSQTAYPPEDPFSRETPFDVGTAYWAIASLHSDTAFVVADQATIRRTSDWGVDWTTEPNVDSQGTILLGVNVVDTLTVVAVGHGGTFLRSIDGGEHWSKTALDTTQALFGAAFSDRRNGTLVGDHGLIYRTSDGGASWVKQDSAKTYPLLGVSFTDSLTGTVVGGNGTILRTTNGGISWTPQTSGVTNYLYGVTFVSPAVGTVVGTMGTILHTTDGGATWTKQTSNTTKYFYAVSFKDSATGMAVGSSGTIAQTTDGGTTWLQKAGVTSANLYGVSFRDTAIWMAVGAYGVIVRKRDTSLVVTQVAPPEVAIPVMSELRQNFPNPFNPLTTIEFVLAERADVKLTIHDVLGRVVAHLVDATLEPGVHRLVWDGDGCASGVYYCRLETFGTSAGTRSTQTRKMLLMK